MVVLVAAAALADSVSVAAPGIVTLLLLRAAVELAAAGVGRVVVTLVRRRSHSEARPKTRDPKSYRPKQAICRSTANSRGKMVWGEGVVGYIGYITGIYWDNGKENGN